MFVVLLDDEDDFHFAIERLRRAGAPMARTACMSTIPVVMQGVSYWSTQRTPHRVRWRKPPTSGIRAERVSCSRLARAMPGAPAADCGDGLALGAGRRRTDRLELLDCALQRPSRLPERSRLLDTAQLLVKADDEWLAKTTRAYLGRRPDQESAVRVLIRLSMASKALLKIAKANDRGMEPGEVDDLLAMDGRVASAIGYMHRDYAVNDLSVSLGDIGALMAFEGE